MKIIVSQSATVHASIGRDPWYLGRCRTLCGMHLRGDEIDGLEASDVTCVFCLRALAEAQRPLQAGGAS